MISGLAHNQAVKFQTGYLVSLPSGEYEINGQQVTVGYNASTFVESLESIKRISKVPKKLLKYVDQDGREYSQEDYWAVTRKYWDDDEEEIIYPSLEAEYENKKEIERFNQMEKVYSEEKTYTVSVEIDVVGSFEDTGSLFIDSPIRYGQLSFLGGRGVYRLAAGKVASDEVSNIRKEYPDASWDVPTHSNVEYVKVNGSYVIANQNLNWIKQQNSERYFESLKEAQEYETYIRTYIRKQLMVHLKPKQVSDILTPELIQKVRLLKSRIVDIDPKQKSLGDKRAAVNMVDGLLEVLVDLHEENQ